MTLLGLQERTVKKTTVVRPIKAEHRQSDTSPELQEVPTSAPVADSGSPEGPTERLVADPSAPDAKGAGITNEPDDGSPSEGKDRRNADGRRRPHLRSNLPTKTGPDGDAGAMTTRGTKLPARNRQNNDNSGNRGNKNNRGNRNKGGGKKNKLNVSPPRPGAPPIEVLPTASAARRKGRHIGIVVSFFLFVVAPVAVAGWYLYERAADQYASVMGFSVRKEETASAAEAISGIVDFGSGNTSDTDVLYEFIQSQGLVESIDQKLDLRTMFSKPDNDPVFTIEPDAPIEKLVSYWKRMITIYYDGGTGLIETRSLAFTPDDAQAISRAIFEESSSMINGLTTVARDDVTAAARNELEVAKERLRTARNALTDFRARTQIVDPNIDIQGQMGLLTNLQAQLAEALIELDLLMDNTREGDPRLRQAEQRIDVIENRIAEERKKFGIGETGASGRAYASLVGEYEILTVDRQFAETSYLSALANFDAALAEAQRKTRYLAAYAEPTLAQSSEYPQRDIILGVFSLFAFAVWAIGALIYYSVRDRR